jgi:hypothetical protein
MTGIYENRGLLIFASEVDIEHFKNSTQIQ